MKKLIILIVLTGFVSGSCGAGNKHDINVKRDFEYLYDVIEVSFLTMVKGIKTNKKDQALDAIEANLKKESKEIEMVGVRLNSIILKEKESLEIIRFNERYEVLTTKYIDYIERNVNAEQKDRFVSAVVNGVAKKFTDQLLVPKNSTDFFKKAIR